MLSLKPNKRSKARIYVGTKYYRLKRYSDWWFGTKKYVTRKCVTNLLEHIVFTHVLEETTAKVNK